MREKFVSTEELSEITGVPSSTIRVYVGNYRISPFVTKAKLGDRYKVAIKLNKKCAYRLCEIFEIHGKNEAITKLEEYFEEEHGNK